MGSDHHLVLVKIKIRLAKPVRKKAGRIRYNTKKLGLGDLRDTFVAKLQNRFVSLYIEEGIEDSSEERGGPTSRDRIEEQWSKIKSAYLDKCEEVLGKRREEKREWILEETWKKIDKRGAAKNDTNTAKTRI